MAAAAAAGGGMDGRLARLLPGTWRGTYVCSQGTTGMALTLSGTSRGRLAGTWAFYAVPSNPDVPSGSVHLEGSVLAAVMRLEPKYWIDRPEGYGLVDALRANVPVPGARIDQGPRGRTGKRSARFEFHSAGGQPLISGEVLESGCSTFEVSLVPGSGLWRLPDFQCRLSGQNVPLALGRWRRCAGTKTYRHLKRGKKVFSVRVAEGGGVARRVWTVGGSGGVGRKQLTLPTTARKAIFRAVCKSSRRCRAKVTITAGNQTLARGRYAVPPHRSRKVRIALTKAGRTALARKRRVAAKLTIVDPRTHKRESLRVVLKRGRR